MLTIKKPITAGSVVTFRLMTGETLIARFKELTADKLVITRPVVANPVQNENGFGIFYSPFCATVDEDQDYTIPRASLILLPMTPRDELTQSYMQMTSGLEIPPSAL